MKPDEESAKSGPVTQSAGDSFDPASSVNEFLTHMLSLRGASTLTLKAYGADIRQFVAWCVGNQVHMAPASFTRQLLFRYMTSLHGLAGNSIRRKLHSLSSWLEFLVEVGVLERNPARGLPLPRRERRVPKFPIPEEVQKLLAAANTPLENAVVWLLATAGIRRCEAIRLDLDDLRSDGTELRVVGKRNRPRTMPLPRRTQEVLGEYLAVRGYDPGPLLLNRAGNRLGATSLRRLFSRLVRRAGLQAEGFTLHSMRHAYATMLLRAGNDLATVRDLMGHGDISITSQYVHSDTRSKRNAVETLPVLKEDNHDE